MTEPSRNSTIQHHSIQDPRDLFQAIAPYLVIIGMGILLLLVLLVFGSNIRQLFFSAPLDDFDSLSIINGYHELKASSGESWKIEYEQDHSVTFTGIVRFISVNHEPVFPILSHDLLITQGDYADPSLVSTRVNNHHFTWNSRTNSSLSGSIHLLHIVPMNQEIFNKILQIHEWDEATITGWEIQKIDAYSSDQRYLGAWTDSGCNTILVTDVSKK